MEKLSEGNRFRLEILARPENVGIARLTAALFAAQLDFTMPEIEEVKVAVSEAVSNSVVHGYQNAGTGAVMLEGTIQDGSLVITVEDFGQGIEDVQLARQPSFSTDPERMGLGFSFMEAFTDELIVYSKRSSGTKVTMLKKPETTPGEHHLAEEDESGGDD